MNEEKSQKKIILPTELQKSILKFFLKTSIPRKLQQERIKTLSEKKGQE